MVSIAEALEEVKKSEISALERQKQIQQTEARASKLRIRGGLREQIAAGTPQELKRRRKIVRRRREQALTQIGVAREELGAFRGRITERRKEIKRVQAARAARAAEQERVASFNRSLSVARKFAVRGRSGFGETKQVRALIRKIRAGLDVKKKRFAQLRELRAAGFDPIFKKGALVGFESEALKQTITLKAFEAKKFVGISTIGGPAFVPIGGTDIFRPVATDISGGIQLAKIEPPISQLAPTAPTKVERFVERFSIIAAEVGTPSIIGVGPFGFRPRGAVEFGAGIVKGLIPKTKTELAITVGSFAAGGILGAGLKLGGAGLGAIAGTRAVQIGEIGVGTAGIILGGAFAFQTGKEFIVAPTTQARGEVFGRAGREALSFGLGLRGGRRVGTEIVGRIRTRGLVELPTESIIAPEFPRQIFPRIRRGQTAEELRREFQPLLPGETRPAGFTAAPEPFAELRVRRGTSELPGLFQAPRLSPRFLRIAGEQAKLFGLETFGGRPAIFRVTPTAFELTPFVSPRQRGLAPLQPTKEFFETAPKGKAFIPFTKTEKEAVIPFETELRKKPTRFFVKFARERVPIFEFETISGRPSGLGKIKTPTIKGFSIAEASRSLGARPSKITPTTFGAFGLSSRALGRAGRSLSFLPSPTRRIGRLGRPGRPGGVFARGISIQPSFLPSRPSRRQPTKPSFAPTGISSAAFRITRGDIFVPPQPRRELERRRVKEKKPRRKRLQQFPISVSFTAVATDLFGRFPKVRVKGLGLTPEQIRFQPIRKAPRRPTLAGIRPRGVKRRKKR